MKKLLFNIKGLLQTHNGITAVKRGTAMQELPQIDNAWLLIEDGKIADMGKMQDLPEIKDAERTDLSGRYVLPTWVDSHTHLVYASDREDEFIDRLKGKSYQEIAAKGGGILNSAKKIQQTDEDELYNAARSRLIDLIKLGTGAVEIKSGYGLTTDAELKMLRVIRSLKREFPLPIKATFMGAHAVPAEFKDDKDAYLDIVIQEMLPMVAEEQLADFVDVFCEKGFFDLADTEKILLAAEKYQLRSKIHVNQFNSFGGVQLATEHQALSVDHLEELSTNDINALKNSRTLPVALPGCSFFLGIPYTPGRRLIDNDLPLVLASDMNPGSAPSGNMNMVNALACIKMKMLPEETINASTINAAHAMQVDDQVGSIAKGKNANLIITKVLPSYGYMPYAFGTNCIETVLINGKKLEYN
jgi:imidazolonepropionase